MDFEITLTTCAQGWHWSVSVADGGRRVLVAESDKPCRSALEAAAEAEAYTCEHGNPQGMNVKFMPWLSRQFPWTVCFRHEPIRSFVTRDHAIEFLSEERNRSAT